MEPLDDLKKLIFSVEPINDSAWDSLASKWTEVKFSRKMLITRQGQVERYLYFVKSGIQRAFFDHNGREGTLVFTYSPSFSGVLDSFLLQSPSSVSLEALTPSILMRLSFDDLQFLMSEHRSIETWVRKALAIALAGTLQRQQELITYSSEERFKAFLGRSPHLLQVIPQKYLASYLGIDPTNFSKFLSTVKI